MRGHTSNRVLAAALKSLRKRSVEEIKRRRDLAGPEYFEGKADACNELAALLDIELGEG